MIHDSGIANARISPDLQHFFLMLEPQGSLKEQLSDMEELRQVFAIFADEKLLRIILYIYSLPNVAIATSLISQNTGLDQKEVDRCMELLCRNNLATCGVIATTEGEINSYTFRRESFAVPLLCFADEIAKKNLRPFLGEYKRTKPFF